MLAALCMAAGCKQEEVPFYSGTEERINFIVYSRTGVVYPDDLKATYNFNDPEYADMQDVPIPIIVQAQGYLGTANRTVAFKAENTEGTGSGLTQSSYTFPPGQDTVTLHLPFTKEGLVLGKQTTVELTFDYDNGDFLPGVDERQTFTLTLGFLYIPENVGLTQMQWDNNYAGYLFQGQWPWPAGYGPWSSQKALFIVETLGIDNFAAQLPDVYDTNSATAIGTFTEVRQRLAAALEEYRTRHLMDPDTYPALIDEVKGGKEWIAFVEE